MTFDYKKYIFVLLFIFNTYCGSSQSTYFPPLTGTTWETISPNTLGWCSETVDSLLNYLGQKNTKAFILLKDGKIVIEKYFGTFTQDSLWYWASAGKTITSFAVGMAQQENYLKITDTTSHIIGSNWTSCSTIKEEKITVRNQLTMTSGLDDGVVDPHCTDALCLQYLSDAGTRWAYHNGPYTMLDSVIEIATGRTLNTYVTQKIKTPTGITGNFYKTGYDNVFVSNARSMARFGLLILNKGNWNGNQIMTDTGYFNQMTNTSQLLNKSYGYLWWLNGKGSYMVPTSQLVIPGNLSPNAPDDMIAALGKNGQFINVVPSQNLVFIRMGNVPSSGEVPFTFNDTIWQKINSMTCPPTGIKNEKNTSLTIYPIPATDVLFIKLNSHNFNLEIKDVSGQTIIKQKSISDFVELDISGFSRGIYFVNIYDDKGRFMSRKITKSY